MARTGFFYLFLSLFCALFGAVYECFSHGVYSFFMLYAFGFPLILGALPFLALAFWNSPMPGRLTRELHHSGVASLTVGSLFEGVLEIYGTTNRLVLVYWVLGGTFLLSGLILYIMGNREVRGAFKLMEK